MKHDGMDCRLCRGDTRVVDSRPLENYIRRRRKCTVCGTRTTTYEITADEFDEDGWAVRQNLKIAKLAPQWRMWLSATVDLLLGSRLKVEFIDPALDTSLMRRMSESLLAMRKQNDPQNPKEDHGKGTVDAGS